MFRRKKLIEPGSWPEGSGPRVLIENPDLGEVGALAADLRSQGYVVALCPGPQEAAPAERCPLLAGDGCVLAQQADVVVMTTTLSDAAAIRSDHRWHQRPLLVVEPGQEVDPAAVAAEIDR